MNNIYKPNLYYKSIYDIDYDDLRKKGIKYLLFDLDNTLLKVDEEVPNEELILFFEKIKDFKIFIFSNALEKRTRKVSEALGIGYYHLCFKPLSFKYRKFINDNNVNTNLVACIGDQIFTDIKGANKMGIFSILVKPIGKKEFIITRINRKRERKVYKEFNIDM